MRRSVRRSLVVSILVLLGASCGGEDGPSVGDYAKQTEAAIVAMNAKIDDSDEEFLNLEAVTVGDVQVRWAQRVGWRMELLDVLAALEPPEEAADLQAAALDVIAALADAERAIADRAAAASSIDELAGIEEGELGDAFRTADEKAVALCRAAEEALTTDYDPGLMTSTPWVPMEMQDVVDVAFGCTAEDRQGR